MCCLYAEPRVELRRGCQRRRVGRCRRHGTRPNGIRQNGSPLLVQLRLGLQRADQPGRLGDRAFTLWHLRRAPQHVSSSRTARLRRIRERNRANASWRTMNGERPGEHPPRYHRGAMRADTSNPLGPITCDGQSPHHEKKVGETNPPSDLGAVENAVPQGKRTQFEPSFVRHRRQTNPTQKRSPRPRGTLAPAIPFCTRSD